jgi:hypothetical protein
MMWTHHPTPEEEAQYPGLTTLVASRMIHKHTERCGGMNGGKCCWGFPQLPQALTVKNDTGRWITWRGPLDGNVVAYNPRLLMRYQGHVNFIVTSGTCAIGYLLQYPFKGDATIRASIAAAHAAAKDKEEHIDEVSCYIVTACALNGPRQWCRHHA